MFPFPAHFYASYPTYLPYLLFLPIFPNLLSFPTFYLLSLLTFLTLHFSPLILSLSYFPCPPYLIFLILTILPHTSLFTFNHVQPFPCSLYFINLTFPTVHLSYLSLATYLLLVYLTFLISLPSLHRIYLPLPTCLPLPTSLLHLLPYLASSHLALSHLASTLNLPLFLFPRFTLPRLLSRLNLPCLT